MHPEQTAEASEPGPEAIAPPCCSLPMDEKSAASGLAASVAAPVEPDASEAPAPAAPVEAEVALIEIWRPFRQPHSRRPEAKAQRKKPFERQARRQREPTPPPFWKKPRQRRHRPRRQPGNRRPAPEPEKPCRRRVRPDRRAKASRPVISLAENGAAANQDRVSKISADATGQESKTAAGRTSAGKGAVSGWRSGRNGPNGRRIRILPLRNCWRSR